MSHRGRDGRRRRHDDDSLDFDELRDFVKDQVRRAGSNADVVKIRSFVREKGGNVDRVLSRLEERGYLDPFGENRGVRIFERFHRYRRRLNRLAESSVTGLRAHASTFFGVNLFLLIVWALTGGGHPWFLYAAGAWGIGLANHLNSVLQIRRKSRETNALPDLTDDEARYLRRMHGKRTGLSAHATTAVAVSAFMLLVNAVTGGGFPWFLIPTAVLGLSLFIHWSVAAPRMRTMKKSFRGWLVGSGGGRARRKSKLETDSYGENPGAAHPMVHEAAALKRTIEKQLESLDAEHGAIASDMAPLLESYFKQVTSLAARVVELDELVASVSTAGLKEDRARLSRRMEKADDPSLLRECERSIVEIDRQLESIRELGNSREVLELRLKSAANLLKQLQIDLARIKGVAVDGQQQSELLQKKSEELSQYVQDLKQGYSELDSETSRRSRPCT